MEQYWEMYRILCRAASRALDVLPVNDENREGRALLQKALYEAEECYVSRMDEIAETSE